MASLFTSPPFPSLSFSPNTLRPPKPLPRFPLLFVRAQSENTTSAVLWFKHDLRLDDHAGLAAAASKHSSLFPIYVFDHRILHRFSDEMLELVILSLEDLRDCLRTRGSNLMVRFGNVENVIPKLVKEVNASHVYAEEEVEFELRKLMFFCDESLNEMRSADVRPEFVLWRNPFFDVERLVDIPDSFNEFSKLQVEVSLPLSLSDIRGPNMELDWGSIPSFSDLLEFMDEKKSLKIGKNWASIKEKSAEEILLTKEFSKPRKSNQNNSSDEKAPSSQEKERSAIGGGTGTVLSALAAYLRYLEGTSRDDWREVHDRVRNVEAREGASFTKLFGPAVSLGIVSRRRVHYEAIKYEKERNTGFLSRFGYSTVSVSAAIDAVYSMEWYWLMSLKSQISDATTNGHVRIWRWNNYLIQYTVAGHEGPGILLVHGFGAFLEHYRDNVNNLAEAGNRVWAITLLGFGKSEKPNIVYTELMWTELLRDFIVEVVCEPVHLVGNSIGGYFVSILACFWPALANSVVLVNSAGNIVPGYSFAPFTKMRQTSGATWLGARLISFYLRSRIKNILKNCYPTRTERVDDGLINEMLRASNDPGVLVVLESIFSFNLSLPLNFLLKDTDKVLVIQGMKDPISDSKSKMAMMKEHCDGVVIKELDAGHCPHDEVPELVNSIICEWMVTQESELRVGSIPL